MVDKLLFIASSPGCRCQELQMVSDFLELEWRQQTEPSHIRGLS